MAGSRFSVSGATDLVAGISTSNQQLYRRDLTTGVTSLVSMNTAGNGSVNDRVQGFAPSSDGRYVALLTNATNVIPNYVDGNPSSSRGDLYLRDLQTGITTLVSHKAGSPAMGGSADVTRISISDDGRFLSFESAAGDLVSGDNNNASDVFVYDRVTGTTRLASANKAGEAASGAASSISADGRYVVFASTAPNLSDMTDTNFAMDIFRHDLTMGKTELVSVNQSVAAPVGGLSVVNPTAGISSEGRYVAFTSPTRLTDLPTGNNEQLYVRDLVAGTTKLVSINAAGTAGGNSFSSFSDLTSAFSADGRYLTFLSNATDLVAGFTNNNEFRSDLYLRDLAANTTTLVSGAFANQVQGADGYVNFNVRLSADGRVVVFSSDGTRLHPADRNGYEDVFVFDRGGMAPTSPDLAASDATVSATANIGSPINVSWKVTNVGTAAEAEGWQDVIYLSQDKTIDAADTLLTTVSRSGGLAVCASYSGAVTVSLPPALEGNYHILVQTDRRYQVAGDTNRANNIAASSATVAATIPQLTLNVPYADAFTIANQDRYYKITVGAGQNVLFTLDSAAMEGGTELYVRRLDLPQPFVFDVASRVDGRPDQAVPIPFTQEPGFYFVMARSRFGSAASSSFTVTASVRSFAVDSVQGNTGGNTGQVTVAIQGARFTPVTQAQLTAGDITISAVAIDFRSPSLLYATFDLTGRPVGFYDVTAIDGSDRSALLNAFTIVTGTPSKLDVHLVVPGA